MDLRKHIALWLVGIFSFPIFFQPVHPVSHHLHGYTHAAHHCSLCTPERPTPVSCAFDEEDADGEGACPICEYQFSINELPKAAAFSPVVPEIPCCRNMAATSQYFRQERTTKIPRAPPV